VTDAVDAAITVGKGGIYLNVHAQPGARRPRLCGMHGDAVKIAVREAARDGRANAALARLVADMLDRPIRQVEVVSGHTSRRKRLFISGNAAEIVTRIRELLNDNFTRSYHA